MAERIEEQVLREVEALPATNLTRVFREVGRVLPESFGGGCVWQAARLGHLLRQRRPGLEVRHFDLGSRGAHATTISDDGRERLLYEPPWMQVRPFSLTQFERDPSRNTSETYPLGRNVLHFGAAGPHRLRMELLSPRGNPLRTFQYVLDEPVPLNGDDPYGGMPMMDPQDQLYIHLLNPDYTRTILMIGTQTRRINVGRGPEKYFVEGEPGFNSRFEGVAERLEVPAAELRALLHEGVDIHNALHPAP